jgi:hypothetical protein
MNYPPFHDPADFGTFDLAITQVAKSFRFDWDTDVVAGAKVVATHNGKARKTYIVGDGLTISNANRSITILLNGSDYASFVGHTITMNCSFFTVGDIEVTFDLSIIRSPL